MAGKKKVTKKLKFKKNKIAKNLTSNSVEDNKPLDKANSRSDKLLNTTGLDLEKMGNIGKFVKMDDKELEEHVPVGGKGVGNNLTEDEKDSRLVLVHRMILRGFTTVEIADKLGVSTRMVCKIKQQIKETHKRSFTNIDINEWLGSTMAFFDEVRNTSMLMSSISTYTPRDRLYALGVACNAELNKHKFLDYCGVFRYIQGDQSLISEVIEHKGADNMGDVYEAMDTLALDLFGS